jgi:triosephosphate isomerase
MINDIRKKTIVGNWKMHTTSSEAADLAQGIVDGLIDEGGVTIILCPPFPYLALVGEIFKDTRIALGAQNLYPETEGAFTGEISPTMLLDLGCKYVIVGHSERRHKLGESDTFINEKVKVALAAGLDVILCVGETLEQRRANQTEALLDRQLGLGLANVQSGTLRRVSIAYEPVWAIGNAKHHATPQPRRLMLSFERASDRFLAGTPLMKSRSSTEAALFPAMPPLCSGGRASTAL